MAPCLAEELYETLSSLPNPILGLKLEIDKFFGGAQCLLVDVDPS